MPAAQPTPRAHQALTSPSHSCGDDDDVGTHDAANSAAARAAASSVASSPAPATLRSSEPSSGGEAQPSTSPKGGIHVDDDRDGGGVALRDGDDVAVSMELDQPQQLRRRATEDVPSADTDGARSYDLVVYEAFAGCASLTAALVEAAQRRHLNVLVDGLCERSRLDRNMYGIRYPHAPVASNARTFDFTVWAQRRKDNPACARAYVILAACSPCKPLADSGKQEGLAAPDADLTFDVAPRAAAELEADEVVMEQHYQAAIMDNGKILKVFDARFEAQRFYRDSIIGLEPGAAEIVAVTQSATTRKRVAFRYRRNKATRPMPALHIDGPTLVLDDILEPAGAIPGNIWCTHGRFRPARGYIEPTPAAYDDVLHADVGVSSRPTGTCDALVYLLDHNLRIKTHACFACNTAPRVDARHAARAWAALISTVSARVQARHARPADDPERRFPRQAGTYISGGPFEPIRVGSWVTLHDDDRTFVVSELDGTKITVFYDSRRKPEYLHRQLSDAAHVLRYDNAVCSTHVGGVLTEFGPPPYYGVKHLVRQRGRVRTYTTRELYRKHEHTDDLLNDYRLANPLASEVEFRGVPGKGLVRRLATAIATRSVDEIAARIVGNADDAIAVAACVTSFVNPSSVTGHVLLVIVCYGRTAPMALVGAHGETLPTCGTATARKAAVAQCDAQLRGARTSRTPVCILAGMRDNNYVVLCPLAATPSARVKSAWATLDGVARMPTYSAVALAIAVGYSQLTRPHLAR